MGKHGPSILVIRFGKRLCVLSSPFRAEMVEEFIEMTPFVSEITRQSEKRSVLTIATIYRALHLDPKLAQTRNPIVKKTSSASSLITHVIAPGLTIAPRRLT